MRIHSDVLTAEKVREIVREVGHGVTVDVATNHRSRKRKGAVEMKLSGTSSHNNAANTDKAATWDEWGAVLERIYQVDSEATSNYYEDYYDFGYKTNWRFEDFNLQDQHKTHKWEYLAPRTFKCKCDAVKYL